VFSPFVGAVKGTINGVATLNHYVASASSLFDATAQSAAAYLTGGSQDRVWAQANQKTAWADARAPVDVPFELTPSEQAGDYASRVLGGAKLASELPGLLAGGWRLGQGIVASFGSASRTAAVADSASAAESLANGGEAADATATIAAQAADNIVLSTAVTGAADSATSVEALNHATALDFYTNQAGFSEERALQHIGGIDLSQPVNVTTLDAGTSLQQYVRPGQVGNYFAPIGTTPLESGLSVTDQTLTIFQNDSPVTALQSVARPDYLYPPGDIVPGSGAGKGIQYFVPNKATFRPVP
jgi:hypothetical protein